MRTMLNYVIHIWISVLIVGHIQCGNSRSYVTENCGHVIGPDFGAYIAFDRDAEEKKDKVSIPQRLKGTIVECLIVVRGMPATDEETRWMAMHWRSFILHDQAVDTRQNTPEDCKKAYVSVYRGMDRTAPLLGTYCGKDILQKNIEFEGEFVTLFFYVDYRNPDLSMPNAVLSNNLTTSEDTYPYPSVYIRLDVTSFDYVCEDSIRGVVMKCNDSKRCLDDSLRCDYWYSKNCFSPSHPLDKSDQGRFPPALCWVAVTTTTIASTTEEPVPEPFNWVPIPAAVGGIAALITLLWCCCIPGYLSWRCSRLRNVKCLHPCRSYLSLCCTRCNWPCCSRFFPSCVGGYGPGPTGGAAAMKVRQQRLLESCSNGYPNGSQYSGENYPKKSLKSKIFPCLSDATQSGWLGRRHSAVAPMDRISGIRVNEKGSPFPYDRIQHSGYTRYGAAGFPNGSSPYDIRDDPEGLSTGWIKFILSDGGHLREQR